MTIIRPIRTERGQRILQRFSFSRVVRIARRLVYIALLLATVAAPPATARADGPDDYRRALRGLDTALSSGAETPQNIAAQLEALGPITLPDGTSVNPDNTALIGLLNATPFDRNAAQRGLRSLIAEVERPSDVGSARQMAAMQEQLQRILAGAEFQPEPPPHAVLQFLSGLWASAVAAVVGFAERVLRWLLSSLMGGGDNPLFFVVALGGLLVVGALVAWVAIALSRTIAPGVGTGSPEAQIRAAGALETRAEAAALAAAGTFRPAIRALYLATLLRWDERDRLRFDRALTNREVLARARSAEGTARIEELRPLLERFDYLWYGAIPCTAAEYADFLRLADQAWEAA